MVTGSKRACDHTANNNVPEFDHRKWSSSNGLVTSPRRLDFIMALAHFAVTEQKLPTSPAPVSPVIKNRRMIVVIRYLKRSYLKYRGLRTMSLSKSLVQNCIALTILSFCGCKTAGSGRVLSAETATIDPARSTKNSSLAESELVIPKDKFSEKIRRIIVTRRAAAVNFAIKGQTTACARTDGAINRIVTRLVTASNLKTASEQRPSMIVVVACQSKNLKLPETTGGVVLIYPEILRGLHTEDQLASIIAHEMIHYLRSHEEDIETTLDTWMPFRESAVNRAKWENEKEADRLAAKLLANAGFDPFAAAEIPGLIDQQLANTAQWKAGQINFPMDSAEERRMRIQFEIKSKRLKTSPQTPGDMASIKDELAQRP